MDSVLLVPSVISAGSLLVAFLSLRHNIVNNQQKDLEKKLDSFEDRLDTMAETQHKSQIEIHVLTERVTNEINLVHKIDTKLDEIESKI